MEHRLGGHTSPSCLCCGVAVEDDAHVLAGCVATGAAPSVPMLQEAWLAASTASKVPAPPPPTPWLEAHQLPLIAALIPLSTLQHHPLPEQDSRRFLAALHVALAERTAEVLRRRGELMAVAPVAPAHPGSPRSPSTALNDASPVPAAAPASERPGLRRPCGLHPSLQLSTTEQRSLEMQRRHATSTPAAAPQTPVSPRAPPCGEPRRKWLVARLIRLLQEETEVVDEDCIAQDGVQSKVLADLFEERTHEPYTQAPGTPALRRLHGFGKALSGLLTSDALQPPLRRICVHGGRWIYNRRPLQPRDPDGWDHRAAHAPAPVQPLRSAADVDAELAPWLRCHRRLRHVDAVQGLPSIALLFLWEAYKGPFPSNAACSEAHLVAGFTKRLQHAVQRDSELREIMLPVDVAAPLQPGLRDTHCLRWPVQLIPLTADEDDPLFTAFEARWKAYLGTLTLSAAAAPTQPAPPRAPVPVLRNKRPRPAAGAQPTAPAVDGASMEDPPIRAGSASAARPPPRKRNRMAAPHASASASAEADRPVPPEETPAVAAGAPTAVPPPRTRTRSPPDALDAPPPRRRRTLDTWLHPALPPAPPHGRAAEGPPT